MLMDNVKSKSNETKGKYVPSIFFGASIGAVLGLLAYVKDWL
jgi:hypothetical protein